MSFSAEKAALTREEKKLLAFLNDKLTDRGLWGGLSPEDLGRNKAFKSRIVARLEQIREERRALEKQS